MADRQPAATNAGSRRLGRYELIAEIARGGMGTVLLARLAGAGGFQRLFAVKLLHRFYADDSEFVEMLLDEARIAARIHHPNVVSIQEVEQSPEHGYYLVMDYVEGFTLLDLTTSLAQAPWRQRAGIVIRVAVDALNGLEAAHTLTDDEGRPLGVVHRDVSPQNILVSVNGITRVTDFGIAKAATRMTTTRVGQVKGKLAYMAPEQARGHSLDARADVWAVAVVLWESLTGRRLFKGANDSDTYQRVLSAPIQRLTDALPDAPAPLADLLMRGLERDPTRRIATAREFAQWLESIARAQGLLSDPHQIAAWMRQSFASELATRRDAIKHAATGGAVPSEKYSALPGGISVPQLPEKSISITAPPPEPTAQTQPDAGGAGEFDQVLDTVVVAPHPVMAAVTAPDEDFDDDMLTQRMDPEDVSPGVKAAIQRARDLMSRHSNKTAPVTDAADDPAFSMTEIEPTTRPQLQHAPSAPTATPFGAGSGAHPVANAPAPKASPFGPAGPFAGTTSPSGSHAAAPPNPSGAFAPAVAPAQWGAPAPMPGAFTPPAAYASPNQPTENLPAQPGSLPRVAPITPFAAPISSSAEPAGRSSAGALWMLLLVVVGAAGGVGYARWSRRPQPPGPIVLGAAAVPAPRPNAVAVAPAPIAAGPAIQPAIPAPMEPPAADAPDAAMPAAIAPETPTETTTPAHGHHSHGPHRVSVHHRSPGMLALPP